MKKVTWRRWQPGGSLDWRVWTEVLQLRPECGPSVFGFSSGTRCRLSWPCSNFCSSRSISDSSHGSCCAFCSSRWRPLVALHFCGPVCIWALARSCTWLPRPCSSLLSPSKRCSRRRALRCGPPCSHLSDASRAQIWYFCSCSSSRPCTACLSASVTWAWEPSWDRRLVNHTPERRRTVGLSPTQPLWDNGSL